MQAQVGARPTSFNLPSSPPVPRFSHLGRGPLFRSAFSEFHIFFSFPSAPPSPRAPSLSSALASSLSRPRRVIPQLPRATVSGLLHNLRYVRPSVFSRRIPGSRGVPGISPHRPCQTRIRSTLIHLRAGGAKQETKFPR